MGIAVAASKELQLEATLKPVVESLGYCFWGADFLSQNGRSVLRVYIEQEEGITLDDCERVSRQISGVLDVADPIAAAYTLEVSSPGMDRPLFCLAHYVACTGCKVSIRLHTAFAGRRTYRGIIKGVEAQDVVIVTGDCEYLLPIDSIEKARIIPQFN